MNAENAPIHAVLLDQNGGGENLNWEQVLATPSAQGTLWLHLDYSEPTVQQWLNAQEDLSPIVVDALLMAETRPRVAGIHDGLLLVLRGIDHTEGAEADDMVAVRVWSDGHRVITTSRRRVWALEDIATSLAAGNGPGNAAELVAELASQLASYMEDTVNDMADRMDEHEDRMLGGDTEGLRYALAQLRRQTIGLHRYLLPQRDALAHLTLIKMAWLDENARLQIRESGDRIVRYIEDLDSVRDRAIVTHEELLSRVSEQLNKRMYVLSVVAAIFLPLSFLTGLFGVNVGGLPGLGSATAFWVFSFVLLLVVGFQVVLFRWMKWF